MLRVLCSFSVEYIFSFGFSLDSMGIINKLKRYYVAMECADLITFTFAT